MRPSPFISSAVLLAGGIVASGCGGGAKSKSNLQLSLTGGQPLQGGFHYEGWAILGGQPTSTGKFNLNASGAIIDLNGNAIANGTFQTGLALDTATAIVITIEPAGNTSPSMTHFLGGSLANGAASLTVGDPTALGNNFATAAGKYVLAAPTGTASTPQKSGVWFIDLAGGSPAVGLSLPTLPAGWKYEGWAIVGGIPLTTGKFTNPAAPDTGDPYSGSNPGPPFPGEDFLMSAPGGLTFPIDLSGKMVAITIEPDPDDSPGPFVALKPLSAAVSTTAADHVTYTMTNDASAFPTGNAAVK